MIQKIHMYLMNTFNQFYNIITLVSAEIKHIILTSQPTSNQTDTILRPRFSDRGVEHTPTPITTNFEECQHLQRHLLFEFIQ